VTKEKIEHLAKPVVEAARSLSANLGFRDEIAVATRKAI
jgi:hypothetical protein